MDNEMLYDTIFKRKSVRKCSPEKLDDAIMTSLQEYIGTVQPLVPGIRTETRFLEPSEVKGMFRINAPHYVAIFSEPKDNYLANAGFMMQQLDLFLSSKGIGACYQGGSKPVKGLEQPEGLDFVIILAFGQPMEEVHRKSVSEFKREPVEKISTVKGHDGIMEAARLAPSGINNQSWFFTGDDGTINAYYEKSLLTDSMNQINVGIALCHMWLATRHEGKAMTFSPTSVGKDDVPKGHSYIISAKIA